MAELFRKKRDADLLTPDLNKPIKVVPSMFWLLYLGSALIVLSVIVWLIFGWTVESTSIAGLYHPETSTAGEVICFPPLSDAKRIQPGMRVTVYLSGYQQQKYGHIEGTVTYVDSYVTSVNEMQALLGDDMLVNTFLQNGPVAAVICKLEEDPNTTNGFKWSSEQGGELVMQDGSFAIVSVTISEQRPLERSLPALYEIFS